MSHSRNCCRSIFIKSWVVSTPPCTFNDKFKWQQRKEFPPTPHHNSLEHTSSFSLYPSLMKSPNRLCLTGETCGLVTRGACYPDPCQRGQVGTEAGSVSAVCISHSGGALTQGACAPVSWEGRGWSAPPASLHAGSVGPVGIGTLRSPSRLVSFFFFF